MALKRFVNGAESEPFFQKRAPDSRPGLDRDGRAELPVRPHRRRDRRARRGAAGLGHQPGLHRPEPAPRARRRRRSPRRAAGRPRPDPRRAVAARARGGPGHQGGARRLRPGRLAEDVRLARLPHLLSRSSRAGRSPRSAARRSRWRARSSGARPSSPRASGGRRNATACSSTTTRTPRTARRPRPTRSGRRPTRGCPRRCCGTKSPACDPAAFTIDTVPAALRATSAIRRRHRSRRGFDRALLELAERARRQQADGTQRGRSPGRSRSPAPGKIGRPDRSPAHHGAADRDRSGRHPGGSPRRAGALESTPPGRLAAAGAGRPVWSTPCAAATAPGPASA